MMNAAEYRKEKNALMEEYEGRVRAWLRDGGAGDLAELIPFFRDGVTCPEVWFQENNSFRPLFILKEVSLGINAPDELPQYLETWGHPRCFEFAENPFDDIRVGAYMQWRRVVRLAKAMEEIHNGADDCDYQRFDLGFMEGGEVYTGDIEGYKSGRNAQRTANPVHNATVDKIAVMEIKKVGAGQNAASKLSAATRYYPDHIAPFEDLLCRQIELINPTVIVCLGREGGACISQLLEHVKANVGERPWIDGYHHARSSNVQFYEEPLAAYKNYLRGL